MDDDDVPAEQAQHAVARPGSSLAELASAVRELGPSVRCVRPASFGPRFWAAFIDGALVALMSLLFSAAVAVADTVVGLDEDALFLTSGYLVLLLMYWTTEAYGSATPGKSFVGLRVVRHDGRPATRGRRIARCAVKQSPLICVACGVSLLPVSERVPLVEWLPFVFALLSQVLGLVMTAGCLLVLTPSRRALHDLLTGTAVFREEDGVREAGHAFRPLPVRVPLEAVPASPGDDAVTASA